MNSNKEVLPVQPNPTIIPSLHPSQPFYEPFNSTNNRVQPMPIQNDINVIPFLEKHPQQLLIKAFSLI